MLNNHNFIHCAVFIFLAVFLLILCFACFFSNYKKICKYD